jgi:hypothetical protein
MQVGFYLPISLAFNDLALLSMAPDTPSHPWRMLERELTHYAVLVVLTRVTKLRCIGSHRHLGLGAGTPGGLGLRDGTMRQRQQRYDSTAGRYY